MKRYNFKYAGVIGVVALLSLSGCTGDFETINTDPNKIVVGQLSPYNEIEQLIYGRADNWVYDAWYYGFEIMQYTATTSTNSRIGTYNDLTNAFFDRLWSRYCTCAANAVHMMELADKDGDVACHAIGLTIKVMNMEELTALFGDIPYSEAFMARVNGNTTPVFDTQCDVYKQMFAELEEANDIYAKGPVFKKSELDGLYGGDMAKWRKLNNSLMLRLLCRISARNDEMGGWVAEKLQAIVKDTKKYPIMKSNDDNAIVKYTGTTPYANYFYNKTYDSFESSKPMSQLMVKLMVQEEDDGTQTTADPRTRCFYYKNTNTSNNPDKRWNGSIAGASPSQMDSNPSGLAILMAPMFATPTAPYIFMNCTEIYYVLSEMAYKGLIPGGETAAKKYYEDGLLASLQYWADRYNAIDWTNDLNKKLAHETITPTEIQVFVNSKIAGWDLAPDKVRRIAEQKHIANFYVSFQSFAEIQRTGYPEMIVGKGTSANDYTFPTRFSYPTNTIGTNPTNAYAAIARQGWKENNMREHMWYSCKRKFTLIED